MYGISQVHHQSTSFFKHSWEEELTSIVDTSRQKVEPTSVLDLRSPSPRAVSASSSSATNRSKNNNAATSSSSDCNNDRQKTAADVEKVKVTSGQSVAQSSSSGELQDELSAGYGLPLFYTSQGIRQINTFGGYEQVAGTTPSGDHWLLQDVVGAQAAQQIEQPFQNVVQHKQKLEELENELLSSCPPPGDAAPSSFMRWLLDENVVPPEQGQDVLLAPSWQHQQQQQNQMLMLRPQSSLPPHLTHLESFTRRTLPLGASSGPPLFPQQLHFQDQQHMNFLWQQQQQQSLNLQMGLHQRDPFFMGMIQEEPSLFGVQNPGFQRPHFPQQPLHHVSLLEEQQSRLLPRQHAPKREHVHLQQQYEAHHPPKLARTTTPANAQAGHLREDPNSVTRLLLQAAEACESGQDDIAQSILARLNDHHQLFLLQQQQQRHPKYTVPPAQRIALLFTQIFTERVTKRKPVNSSSTFVDRVEACKSLCETSNLVKFAHFVANQTIFEAMETEDSVHILDLSEAVSSSSNSTFGGQWSSFIASTLQQKHPKPIKIRLTLAGTREQPLCFAIERLQELARDYADNAGGAEFEFSGVLTQPGRPVQLSKMGLRTDEVLIVNLVFGLHKLVPVTEVLDSIRSCNPKLVMLVEREIEQRQSFLARFKDCLEYYTALSQGTVSSENSEKVDHLVWKPEIEDMLYGNVELTTLETWKMKMARAGLCNTALSKFSENLVMELLKDSGFQLEKQEGNLLLGCQGKVLASASAWKCSLT